MKALLLIFLMVIPQPDKDMTAEAVACVSARPIANLTTCEEIATSFNLENTRPFVTADGQYLFSLAVCRQEL